MNKPAFDSQFERYLTDNPRLTYVKEEDNKLRKAAINTLEISLGRRKFERLYQNLKQSEFDLTAFFHQAVEQSKLSVNYQGLKPTDIRVDGPLIMLANHPFGIIDGLLLCDLALQIRGDFRIMINSDLCQDKQLAPYFLPVDFEPSKEAIKTNIRSKQLALESLSNDVPVLIFPSGMVSTANKLGFGKVKDGEWTTFAAKLVREAQATVLPVHFHGRNSRKFHIASHIAEPLRMGMLLHEAVNKFGREVKVTIDHPIAWSKDFERLTRDQLTRYLYGVVSALGKVN